MSKDCARSRRRRWIAGLGAAALVVIAGIAAFGLATGQIRTTPAAPGTAPSLAGTGWTVTELHGRAPVAGSRLTLAFGDGRVAGFSGCNHFGSSSSQGKVEFGGFSQDQDRLTIGNPVSTAVGCEDPLGAQEDEYLQALSATQRFHYQAGVLRLTTLFGNPLVELKADSTVVLDASGWQIVRLDGADVVAGQEPSLVFRGESVRVDTGCSTFDGTHTQAGLRFQATLTVHPTPGCRTEALSRQHSAVLDLLQRVERVFTGPDGLSLRTADGKELIAAVQQQGLMANGTWRLVDPAWPNVSITIEGTELSGTTACGEFSATVQQDGGTWALSDLKPPSRRCAVTASDQSETVLDRLSNATWLNLEDRELRIGGDESMVFVLE